MRRWLLLISIAVVISVVIVRLIGDPQVENMAKARAHAPKVVALLLSDARFAEVKAEEFTGHDGSLIIRSAVYSETDLQDLKRIVESTSPPVHVVWAVAYPPMTKQATTQSKPLPTKIPNISN
jgi:hypothetical protein